MDRARVNIFILLSAVAAALCGCASPRGASNIEPLVGHWRYADGTNAAEYVFAADGTFRGSVERDGQLIWQYAGKWSHNGDKLSYTYTKSSQRWLPAGTRDEDLLVEVRPDFYVIQARDGSRRKYKRLH